MPVVKRPKVIAFEPINFDKQDYEVTRSNPGFWKNDGVRNVFDLVHAPSFPEIEKAYKDAGKGVFENPAPQEKVKQDAAEPAATTEALEEAKEELYNDLEQVDRNPDDVSEKESVSDAKEHPQDAPETEDHWSQLSWPKMRSLATEFTDEPVKSKDQAKEVLGQAESEGKL